MNKINFVITIGARPNYPKIRTFIEGIEKYNMSTNFPKIKFKVIHSNQHYDSAMNQDLLKELNIVVDNNLGMGLIKNRVQKFSEIVNRLNIFLNEMDSVKFVVAVGDVDTTLAAAIVANKMQIPLIHIESGLRAGDWEPEEANRKMITICTDYHFSPSELASQNLINEGISKDSIFLVGNTMAETFLKSKHLRNGITLKKYNLTSKSYIIFTVHKTHNLEELDKVAKLLNEIARNHKVVFPVHPNLHEKLKKYSFNDEITFLNPLPYMEFGKLLEESLFVVTDSAGVQEEATVACIPCFTIGHGTARPETLYSGSNTVIGYNWDDTKVKKNKDNKIPKYWDERVSDRIAIALDRIINDGLF